MKTSTLVQWNWVLLLNIKWLLKYLIRDRLEEQFGNKLGFIWNSLIPSPGFLLITLAVTLSVHLSWLRLLEQIWVSKLPWHFHCHKRTLYRIFNVCFFSWQLNYITKDRNLPSFLPAPPLPSPPTFFASSLPSSLPSHSSIVQDMY